MVTVRQADARDRPAIFAFIEQAYPGRWQFKIPERWDWEFVSNPFLRPGEIPVWIAVNAEGEVVGQSGALVERLQCGSRTLRVGWGVDAYVSPAYRGRGVARRLQHANCCAHDVFLSVSMANTIRRIKSALGLVPMAPVATYLRPYPLDRSGAASALLSRLAPAASAGARTGARVLRVTGADLAVSALYNARRSWMDSRAARTQGRDITISKVTRFGPEVDLLWDSVSSHYDALIKRDAAHLNWKYVQQPFIEYERFAARRHDTLCGYMILRKGRSPEPGIGILTELFVAPNDEAAAAALVAHAVRVFRERRSAGIMTATNVPAYERILSAFGFVKVREDIPMVKFNRGPDAAAGIDQGRWFLCKGDHDWDQYPLGGV